MVGKDIGVDVVAQRAQQQDGENGNGTGVALVEGVDVPDAGGEEGNPFEQVFLVQLVVMLVALELEVAVERHAQLFPMQIEHGVFLEHPFAFHDVGGTQLSGVVVDAVENLTVQVQVAIGGEVKLFVEQHVGNVAGHLVGLLLFFLIGCGGGIAFVVFVDMLADFIDGETSFDVLACRAAHFV